jgi:hypothetical protein
MVLALVGEAMLSEISGSKMQGMASFDGWEGAFDSRR